MDDGFYFGTQPNPPVDNVLEDSVQLVLHAEIWVFN